MVCAHPGGVHGRAEQLPAPQAGSRPRGPWLTRHLQLRARSVLDGFNVGATAADDAGADD
jgi:hypothetical protein